MIKRFSDQLYNIGDEVYIIYSHRSVSKQPDIITGCYYDFGYDEPLMYILNNQIIVQQTDITTKNSPEYKDIIKFGLFDSLYMYSSALTVEWVYDDSKLKYKQRIIEILNDLNEISKTDNDCTSKLNSYERIYCGNINS